MISDAIDVLDGKVINFGVQFEIVAVPDANKNTVVQSVANNLVNLLKVEKFQIDQPILLADLQNTIINTPGVLSLVDLKISSVTGDVEDRKYSTISFNVDANTYKGMIIRPPGSIFEMKYPLKDITGLST